MVDPIKLNQTLTATAHALDGLGDRVGQSVTQGNEILADLNPQLPQIRYDTQRVADLAGVYGNAAPDLFDGLENAVTTAATLNEQQANLDETLLAEDHPRSVARPVSGAGHRRVHRAVQPLRARAADVHRICLGTPDRGVHDQPLASPPT
jgi:ABC-type transporter Mla subunit MlaD